MLCVKNKMEILYTISIIVFIVSVAAWLFNWLKACSFLKEPNALSFLFWPNVFFSEKFKPEGEEYRKKALNYLFIQIFTLTILMVVNGK